MTQSHSCQLLAASRQACGECAQFSHSPRKNQVVFVQVCRNIHPTKPQGFSSFWLPSLHPSSTTLDQKSISKVGRPFHNWHLLVPFPHHASSVPLVLSTQTGLISPQFHCVFDDDFDTVWKEQANMRIWKSKAHLQDAKIRVIETTT